MQQLIMSSSRPHRERHAPNLITRERHAVNTLDPRIGDNLRSEIGHSRNRFHVQPQRTSQGSAGPELYKQLLDKEAPDAIYLPLLEGVGQMTRLGIGRGKQVIFIALWVTAIAVLAAFLLPGPAHNHGDLNSHSDCAACHWQTSGFSLIPERLILLSISAVAILEQLRLRAPVHTRALRVLSIRAPPATLA